MKKTLLVVLSLGLAVLMVWGLAGCVRPRPNPSTPVPTKLSLNPTKAGTTAATPTAGTAGNQEDVTPTATTAAGTTEATAVPTAASEQPTAAPEQPTAVPQPTAAPTSAPVVETGTSSGTTAGTTASNPSTYEVRWGDTLTGIARRFGTTIEAILAANPRVTDRNRVYAGTVLTIPGSTSGGGTPSTPPVAAGEAIDYVVQYGDTLSGIARRFGTTVEAILQENPWITNRNYVPAGKHLAVTVGASGGGPGATTPQSYTVVAGDTLTGIARRFNTTVWAIMVRNNISNRNLIYAGQVLIIG